MAKVKNISQQQIASLGDAITFYYWKGKPYARARKPKKGPRHSSRWEETKEAFRRFIKEWKMVGREAKFYWRDLVQGTDWTPRDIFIRECFRKIFTTHTEGNALLDVDERGIDEWDQVLEWKGKVTGRYAITPIPIGHVHPYRPFFKPKGDITCRPPPEIPSHPIKRLYCTTLRTLRCKYKEGYWTKEYKIDDYVGEYEDFWKKLRAGFLDAKPNFFNPPYQLAFYAEVTRTEPDHYKGRIVYSAISFQTNFSKLPLDVSPDDITQAWIRLYSDAFTVEPGAWVIQQTGEEHPLWFGILEWGHLEKYFKEGEMQFYIVPKNYDPDYIRPPKPRLFQTEFRGHLLKKPPVSIKYCHKKEAELPYAPYISRYTYAKGEDGEDYEKVCQKCWNEFTQVFPGYPEGTPGSRPFWESLYGPDYHPPMTMQAANCIFWVCPKDHFTPHEYYKYEIIRVRIIGNCENYQPQLKIKVMAIKKPGKIDVEKGRAYIITQPPFQPGETSWDGKMFDIPIPRKFIPYEGGYLWILFYPDSKLCAPREGGYRILSVAVPPRLILYATGQIPNYYFTPDVLQAHIITSWDPNEGVVAPPIVSQIAKMIAEPFTPKKAHFIDIFPTRIIKHEKKEGVGTAPNQDYDTAWENAKQAFEQAEFQPTEEKPVVGLKTQTKVWGDGLVQVTISLNRVIMGLNLKNIPGNPNRKFLKSCYLEYTLSPPHDPIGTICMPEINATAPFELGLTYAADLFDYLDKYPEITLDTDLPPLDEARPDDPLPGETEIRDSQIELDKFRARILFVPQK